MSYEIAKTISLNKKKNQIFITSTSNNVHPKTYEKWEYMKHSPEYSYEDKLAFLMKDIMEGNIHIGLSTNEPLFALLNNTQNEDYQKIRQFLDNKIWQNNVDYDKRIKRTPDEYEALIKELRKMLIDYYNKYIGETKEKKYLIKMLYGGYLHRVNQWSFSYGGKSKARVLSKLACEAIKSKFINYTWVEEEIKEGI